MYNLLMMFSDGDDVWQANQGRLFNIHFLRDRVFEHTSDDIIKKFTNPDGPDFEALKELPCLFTYEGTNVAGAIGRITEVARRGTIFEINYILPPGYPTIRMNDDSVFESVGIRDRSERTRTHWAVKDVDLFEATTRLLHAQGDALVVLSGEQMRNVWGDGYGTKKLAFLSHNARHSQQAAGVKAQLEQRGLCCFLAHADIVPSTIWHEEILKALNTMDIFIGLVTDDFHGGGWTDQETGYAIHRSVPRVFVKLESLDPEGMVAREQALNTDWENAGEAIFVHLRSTGKLRQ